jgi:hypothetical protein
MTNLLQRIYDAANDVVTADVDNTNTTTDTLEADTTNSDIYQRQNSEISTWEILEEAEEGFDWSNDLVVSNVDDSVYQRIKITVEYDGSIEQNELICRINNNSNTDYGNKIYDSAGSTGDTEWQLTDSPSQYGMVNAEFIITTDNPRPSIFGIGSDNSLSGGVLRRGTYDLDETIFSIRLIAPSDALGQGKRVRILGER